MKEALARILTACVAASATCMAQSPSAPPPGRPILTEASVWRGHVTWGTALTCSTSGIRNARIWGNPGAFSPMPPDNWTQPDFDDSSWFHWRETHTPNTLKLKDKTDTSVRVYDEWQYGIQLSAFAALRCLRGRFLVSDPAQVKDMTLTVQYRGGIVAFLNGREIGRGHVPAPTNAVPDRPAPAESYPDDICYESEGKLWRLVNTGKPTPDKPEVLEQFNRRIRTVTLKVPSAALRKGANVLALSVHRAPYCEKAGRDGMGWSTCGIVTIELRGDGAVESAVSPPKGLHVWNASTLTRIAPYGSVTPGRIGQGAGVRIYNFPQCWPGIQETPAPIRIVGTRNGVFSGQIVISSDATIRNPRAQLGDLTLVKGSAKIPASACRISYSTFSSEPPATLNEPAVSLLDVLYDKPPAEVPVTTAKPMPPIPISWDRQGVSWCESAALVAAWLTVRIPSNAQPGEYEGKLTVSAGGAKPAAIPVRLAVHDFALPNPKDFAIHAGLTHSPDTLALKYKVPLWSDAHFALIEKTLSFMAELGGDVVYIPLIVGAWPGNREGMVYWVKQADAPGGQFQYDFRVFDRYLDLVQKHLKPEIVCLQVYHPPYPPTPTPKNKVSVRTADGKVETMETPVWTLTPEAETFWKPVIAEARARLKKRGLPEPNLGLVVEGGGKGMEEVVNIFQSVWPEGKWVNLAHYGARQGKIFGASFGYVMSVWGNQTPFKTKANFGAGDLPLMLIQHYRADPVIDLRPISRRGSLFFAPEASMWHLRGIGPIGMDFWNLTGEEIGPRARAGSLETYVTNLRMCDFSAGALLAPGPEGPLPTARFEIFRQGLQYCEARAVAQKTCGDPARRDKLPPDLVKRYEDWNKENKAMWDYMACGERFAQGEGWKWFDNSGWEDRAGQLFDIAAQASKVLTGK